MVILGTGCPQGPPPSLPDGGPDEPTIEGTFGLLNLVEAGDTAELHAVFARDLPSSGIIDGTAWLGVANLENGFWRVPEVSDEMVPVAELESDWTWSEDEFYDVGEFVAVGEATATRREGWSDQDWAGESLVYYLDDGLDSSEPGFDGPLGVSWPGGADVEAVDASAQVAPLEPLAVTSHDPQIVSPWFEGTDLELEWDTGDGEIWITLLGDQRWFTTRSGGGTFTVPAHILDEAALDTFEVRVSRTRLDTVAVGPGALAYRTTREERLAFERLGTITLTPDVLHLGSQVTAEAVHHDGVFVDGATTFDLGEGVVVESVTLPDGTGPLAQLQLTVSGDAPTGQRPLTVTIDGDQSTVERAFEVLLPPAETCEESYLITGGNYHGNVAGQSDDYSDPSACTGHAAEGPDAVYALEIGENTLMAATLHIPGADAVLYLIDDCEHAATPVVCADIGGQNLPESLSHAPLAGEGGVFYLVVDSSGALPAESDGGFILDVEIFGF